jgi:hypothetical protein
MIFVDKSEAKGRRKSSFSCAAQNERTLSSKRERTAFWFLFRWKNVLKNE